jgi:hypothetical protein
MNCPYLQPRCLTCPDLQIEVEPNCLAITPPLDSPRGGESIKYGQPSAAIHRRFDLESLQILGRVRITHLGMETMCPNVKEKNRVS